jgi:hypothetical protein
MSEWNIDLKLKKFTKTRSLQNRASFYTVLMFIQEKSRYLKPNPAGRPINSLIKGERV